jgi:predicted dehydrogenase
MSEDRAVRLALLGCGWIARNRLRQIGPDGLAEVVMVVDPQPEACIGSDDWAPGARIETCASAFDAVEVDAVMISTPSGLHAGQAMTLLERGIPVFVQKPVGVSAAEVARVLDAAARHDLPLDTDLCYRHLQSAGAVRQQLRDGAIGRPYYIEGRFHNAYRPSARWSTDLRLAGGGALMDLGIHLIDLVTWLTGRQVAMRDVHLRNRGRPVAADELEDFARLDLRLDDGVEVELLCSWDASIGRDAEIRLTVYGDNGTLELVNRDGSFFDFDARRCFGTWVDHLAADTADGWQAGPLRHWLQRVRCRARYAEPEGVRQTAALIDAAYTLGRPTAAVAEPARPRLAAVLNGST